MHASLPFLTVCQDHAVPEPNHPTNDAIDLCAGEFWGRDPHDELAWMREHAPVYWDGGVWGVASYEAVKAVSKQPETYSNAGGIRPGYPPLPMMIDMDDPPHWQRRKLVNKGFTPRRVRDSEPAIRRACTEIIDAVCERGECDFVRDVAAWLPMIMIGDALGVRPEHRADLLRWSDDMVKGQSTSASEETILRAADAFAGYVAYATEVIAERRANPTDDLMSVLVHAEVDGDRFSDDALIHESLLILVGGDETTRHVISGGMYQLLVNPDQRAALDADPDVMTTAIEEMLRWVSPIKNMARTVTHDVELCGQRLDEGDELLLLYSSANRDESVFDDPFRFDVRREPNEHVAFGFGTHFCLGNSLARLELRVMFEELLRRLPDLRLADESSAEPAHRPANFISGYESMPVVFSPTSPETAP
jgi:cytochrome P450 family 142 subfamily A polypeptide 1